MKVKIKKLFEDVELPQYATKGSAGFDIVAHNFKSLYIAEDPVYYVGNFHDVSDQMIIQLTPGSRVLVGAGFSVEVPEGYELQVRPRSGNALKLGVTVLNSPGTIDSDYRGEVGVILHNSSKHVVSISLGEKLAQAVFSQVEQAEWEDVEVLTETERGEGGFGSTDQRTATVDPEEGIVDNTPAEYIAEADARDEEEDITLQAGTYIAPQG